MQGGGEGHEAQLALVEAPEIRQKLHHKDGCPTRSQRRHLANPQGGEYEGSSGAATPGNGDVTRCVERVDSGATPRRSRSPSLIPVSLAKTRLRRKLKIDPAHLEAVDG